MASKVVSIEITDAVTRMCEIAYGKANPTVYKCIIFDNPDRVVEDGFVMDRNAYGAILRQQFAANGIKTKDVVFAMASNKIISREVLIPQMKEDLIPELIENERGEYFPMDTSGHVFTYNILDTDKETKQMRLMVFAAPETIVKNYVAIAAENDLRIVALDYAGNTSYQWLSHTGGDMDIYLQINEKNSMITILENKKFALQRNMNFGTSSLVQNLQDEGYYPNISQEDAALKLRDNRLIYASYAEMVGFVPDNEEEARLHETKVRVTEAIRPLVANVSRVLEYYNTKNREAKVTKIVLGGAGASVNGLAALLESEFDGIEFEVCTALPGAGIIRSNNTGLLRSSEFIACIGAGLKTINFIKADEKKEQNRTLIFALVGLVLVIGASVFIVLNGKSEYDDAVQKKKNYEAKVAELEATGIEQLEIDANNASMNMIELAGMHMSTIRADEIWNEILSLLESEGLSNMRVGSLSSNDAGLSLNFSVGSKQEAAKLLMQLRKIEYFSDITVNGISEEYDEELRATTVTFSVLCSYDMNAIAESLAEVE